MRFMVKGQQKEPTVTLSLQETNDGAVKIIAQNGIYDQTLGTFRDGKLKLHGLGPNVSEAFGLKLDGGRILVD